MRPVPLVAFATILASPLFAQAPLSEKIEVSVVDVDVTVTDGAGNPVRDLTRDDFQVFEDGVPQPITNFYSVGDAAAHDDRFRRKVLLIIDKHSMTAFERDRALVRIEEFVADRFRGGEYDWSIAAIEDDALHMLLPPTSDKSAIHEALAVIRRGGLPVPQQYSWWNAAHGNAPSVDALIEAMRAFGSASGKKIVLLITGQLWTSNEDLVREANASNVNLYILNPAGPAAGNPLMYWIARKTGGRLLPGNRLDESLRSFDAGTSSYYSLGYRPAHTDDSKYHRLQVRLNKGNYALQYRDGYASLPDEQQIARTLGSPFGTFMLTGSAIPVNVSFDQPREVKEGVIVTMKTRVPTDKTTSRVDVFVSLFDWTGRNVFSFQRTLAEPTEFFVRHGRPYRVVVAVRDQGTEAVGVTQQVVQF